MHTNMKSMVPLITVELYQMRQLVNEIVNARVLGNKSREDWYRGSSVIAVVGHMS